MRPSLVVVTTDQETNAQLKKLGVGFLEVRVDLFKRTDPAYALKVIEQRKKLRIPLLLTVRNQKKEGAAKEMTSACKWTLLQALLPHVQWVDIELSNPLCRKTVLLARQLKKKVVVSIHDFNGTPAHLPQFIKKGLSTRADMVKLAVFAKDEDDLLKVIDVTHRNRHLPIVTMCIGPLGGLSRIILPMIGSRWVYSFCRQPAVPGQVDVATLKTFLGPYLAPA